MAVTAALCSSTALVATVVPWMKRSTLPGAAPARARILRTAAPMPSSKSFGVVGTLVSTRRPSRPRATMSGNVPPMSTPICPVLLPAATRYHGSRDARGRVAVPGGALERVRQADECRLAPGAAQEGQPDRCSLGGVASGHDGARVARLGTDRPARPSGKDGRVQGLALPHKVHGLGPRQPGG